MTNETPDQCRDSDPFAAFRALDDRDVRALTDVMSVLGDVGRVRGADGLYLVVSSSGTEYTVDAIERTCDCRDHTFRSIDCKHIRRVLFETGRRPIPALVDRDGIDDQFGQHVDADPVFATADPAADDRRLATDGGANVDADADGEDETESESDRPDDCECGDGDTLACAACFIAGFDDPNPDAPGHSTDADADTDGGVP